jgi:hypothetical protein
MNCEETSVALIVAVSDGTGFEAGVKAHLERCAGCREKAEDMRRFVALLRMAGHQERERSERKKRETLARMREEFARQDRAAAAGVEEGSGAGPGASGPAPRATPPSGRGGPAAAFDPDPDGGERP